MPLDVIPYQRTTYPTDLLPAELIAAFGGLGDGPRPVHRTDVAEQEPLREVILRVASQLAGAPIPSDLIWSMWVELIDAAGQPLPWTVVVDASGQASWDFEPLDQTVADFRRTVDMQAIPARPDAIFVMLDANRGLGGGGDAAHYWQELITLISTVQPYIRAMADAAAIFELLRSLGSAIQKHSPEWSSRKAQLARFRGLLRSPRTTDQVAGLFGCDHDEAELICKALGCRLDSTGVWRPSHHPSDRELGELVLVLGELAEWYVSVELKGQALRSVLAFPVGKRREQVEPVLSQLTANDV